MKSSSLMYTPHVIASKNILYSQLHMVLVEGLVEVVLVEVQHVDYSLRCEQDPTKKGFIRHNAAFLLEAVLPRLQQRFQVRCTVASVMV